MRDPSRRDGASDRYIIPTVHWSMMGKRGQTAYAGPMYLDDERTNVQGHLLNPWLALSQPVDIQAIWAKDMNKDGNNQHPLLGSSLCFSRI